MKPRIALLLLSAGAALVGAPFAQGRSSTSRPMIRSVKASASAIPAKGGTVSVNAYTEHATTCIFSGVGLNSLPAPCASGVGGASITFVANTGSSDHLWTIYVIAKGSGGTSRWAHMTLDQPSVSSQGNRTTQAANPSTNPTGVPAALAAYLDTCIAGPDCYYGPITNAYSTYGNLGPSALQDCTFAAAAYWEQIVLGVTPESSVIESDFAAAGGTPNGLPITALWSYWTEQGINGITLAGITNYATDHADVENAVRDYGALIAILQFGSTTYVGQYAVAPGSQHVVVVDGFTPEGPLVVTWGQTLQMTWQQWDAEATALYDIAAH